MRSNLTIKYTLHNIHSFQKSLALNKEIVSDIKNKNISRYITVDVINRKGLPDLDDCVTLIKLGNNNCDDDAAYDILQRWLDDEHNKERGILGAFCDLCKDYALDVPVDGMFKDHCDKLEDVAKSKIELQDRMNKLLNSIVEASEKFTNIKENEIDINNN